MKRKIETPDNTLAEMQNPETWVDDGEDELRPPVKRPRAIVSVAFSRDDFERVTDLARQNGLKTSEYIRKAALGEFGVSPAQEAFIAVSGVISDYRPPRSEGARATTNISEDAPSYESSWTTR